MFRLPATTLRAAAFSISALLATAAAVPASAQVSVSIGFDDFHSRLAPYGTWSNNPRWGEVWHPTRVASNFRPYYDGHWVDTREYGWLWVSDESWGDVPYHYGRWIHDPRDGWLWVPGYVWAPSWVVWRSGGGNIGWFPMPPDDNYYGDGAYNGNYDNDYGYRDWYGPSFSNDQFLSLWIFVPEDHFRDQNYRNYAVPERNYSSFIGQTRDTTSYVTVNNYVVNRSVDSTRLQRDTKQSFQPVAASTVLARTAPVTQATVGRQVEQRERKAHPIPASINPAEIRGGANNGKGIATPQVERAVPVAPAANAPKPNGNRAPQGAQGTGNNRNPGTNGANRANPQAERAAPAAPEAKAPEQPVNKAPQGAQERGNNRNQGANGAGPATPQAERVAPAAPATPAANNASRQNGNRAPQDAQGRGGNRNQGANEAAPPAPQAERAPAAVTPPPNLAAAPPRRATAAPDAKAVVQDKPAAPRAKADAPPAPAAAGDQGNGRNNQARGNKPADANAANDQKAAADKKAAEDKKNKDSNGPN